MEYEEKITGGNSMQSLPAAIIALIIVILIKSKGLRKLEEIEKKEKANAVDLQINKGLSPAQAAKNNRQSIPAGSGMNYPSRPMASQGRPAQQTRPQQSRPAQRMPASSPATAAAAVKASGEGMSTTEMLAQKAALDQKEHRLEEYEQRQHEKKYYSNYHYAKRYMLGDPVSPTEKILYCPNCAAENLIKIHENPRKYNCYFCRANLGGEE
ncbi:MAG: hypothetical protein J5842_08925 [Lachnospiraceae bacterium]|nr:hypothetical protein [Lachnospiraceae bacterium]